MATCNKRADTSLQPLHLLVVEDEPAMQRLVWHHVNDKSCRVTIAESAEEALRHLVASRPDVLLVDVMLPGIDGLEFLRRIQDYTRQATIIVLSAHADIATAVEALRLGADEFLPKPVDVASLKRAINRARGEPKR